MSNLVKLNAGPKAPADLAKTLRELADSVDAGKITGLIAAYEGEGEYLFTYAASIRDCMYLAVLLHDRCLQRCHE